MMDHGSHEPAGVALENPLSGLSFVLGIDHGWQGMVWLWAFVSGQSKSSK